MWRFQCKSEHLREGQQRKTFNSVYDKMLAHAIICLLTLFQERHMHFRLQGKRKSSNELSPLTDTTYTTCGMIQKRSEKEKP